MELDKEDYLKMKKMVQDYESNLKMSDTDSHHVAYIPSVPSPPLSRIIKEGGLHFCNNCGSTSSKKGFLSLFGERLCDNIQCPYSKTTQRYHT